MITNQTKQTTLGMSPQELRVYLEAQSRDESPTPTPIPHSLKHIGSTLNALLKGKNLVVELKVYIFIYIYISTVDRVILFII